MNKRVFIESIIEYIKKNKISDYNDIIKYVMYDKKYANFLRKKKDITDYMFNLRYDKYFRLKLRELGLCVQRNKILSVDIINKNNKRKDNKYKEILSTISDDDVACFSCPYNETIRKLRCGNKNKERLDKYTNERTFNYILNKYHSTIINSINNYFYSLKSDIQLHLKGSLLFNLSSGISNILDIKINKKMCYINTTFHDNVLLDYVNVFLKIYPFTHLEYSKFIIASYGLYSCGYINEVKYLYYVSLNIMKEHLCKKYFGKNYKNNYGFVFFGDSKIMTLINNDVDLIVEIFNNFNKYNVIISEFLVASYKLFVYFKNKINREIRKISKHFYEENTTYNKSLNLSYLDNCINEYYNRYSFYGC